MSDENFYTLINKIATDVAERTADKILMLIENKFNDLSKKTQKDQEYLTVKECTKRYKLSAAWFNNKRSFGGGMPYIKIGGKILYPLKQTDEWFEKHMAKNVAETLNR